jgi:hypothetical protein
VCGDLRHEPLRARIETPPATATPKSGKGPALARPFPCVLTVEPLFRLGGYLRRAIRFAFGAQPTDGPE